MATYSLASLQPIQENSNSQLSACKMNANVVKFPIAVLSFMFLFAYCHGANSTFAPGQSVRDGETMLSPSETFALGFFSPGDSPNRYLGIWYNKISLQTIVWVANRENPVTDSSGVLTLADDGNLVVLDGRGRSLWSSNSSNPSRNATAYFLDTGNLVLSVGEVQDPDRSLWQSFDYPTDTYLPGMKAGLIPRSRKDLFTSWKSASDPARGNFSFGVDPEGLLEVVVWRGAEKRWRSGLWDGQIFIGVPSMSANSLYYYGFQLSEVGGRRFFSYTVNNSSEIVQFRLRWDGTEEQLRWDEGRKEWNEFWAQPTRECEVYNTCGAYGSCSTSTSPICSCLQGFEPKSRTEWDSGNWSGGCVRRTELQCERNVSSLPVVSGDQFLQMDGVKLPDLSVSIASNNRSQCETFCLNNCSCKAYAYVTGIQCLTWGEEFVDVRQFQEGGQTFYLRLAASELGASTSKSKVTLIVVVVVVVGIIMLCTAAYILWRYRGKLEIIRRKGKIQTSLADETRSREYWNEFPGQDDAEGNKGSRRELTMHTFQEILTATNNFSFFNKLGEGGFGPVYKGKLPCGLDVAVKRLSRKSGQGLEEFKNEIVLIAKLQHRNLVRLVGFCVEEEEKMLLYEYLPNKSLDVFLFAANPQQELDWSRRFNIIEGIARGILYLHRDSRLRIIHRDLKASNILLDEEMNPKISDFGMAKIFGGNQNQANTNRVVGTYGYMAPEYAMEGLFSVKSDVYSFGVLLLEIISGKRNKYRHPETSANLVGYAWKLWSEERAMEFIDSKIRDSCSQADALRCLNVGLLCVQDSAMDRPIMSTVVLMLESETAILSTPQQPTFTMGRNPMEMELSPDGSQGPARNPMEIELSLDNSQGLSRNGLTNTMVIGR